MKTSADSRFPTVVEQAGQASDRREFLKMAGSGVVAVGMLSSAGVISAATPKKSTALPNGADNFYTSDKLTVQKVSFKNQYQMTVTGNLFVPKTLDRKKRSPAIVVGHPMGR